jgi:phage tail-like protein
MATDKATIKATYPLPVYNFRVDIGADSVAFTEVSGLSMSHEKITNYAESPGAGQVGPQWKYMPAQSSPVTLTLKKGVMPQKSLDTFFNWFNSIATNLIEKKDIKISLCDEDGKAVISWNVKNAFPTKLDAPSFSATSNDVAIESMELTADSMSVALAA